MIRTLWLAMHPSETIADAWARVGPLAKHTLAVDPNTTANEAGQLVRLNSDASGVAITGSESGVRWIAGETISRSIEAGQGGLTLRDLESERVVCVSCRSTIGEAMAALAANATPSRVPVLLSRDESGEIGIVPTNAVLLNASVLLSEREPHLSPVTNLPDRVRCDEHLSTLLGDRCERANDDRHAIAVINAVGFAQFNREHGVMRGDDFLVHLARSLRTHLTHIRGDAFVGHLGHDRFLASGESASLRVALGDLIRSHDAYCSPWGGRTPPSLEILIRDLRPEADDPRSMLADICGRLSARGGPATPGNASVLIDLDASASMTGSLAA